MKRNDGTRLALMRAAERLFAERGVEAVSLREIAVAAGQRNNSSALYHFGDKRELIEATLARHSDAIDEALPAALARLRDEGLESLETIVELLVDPLLQKLDDEDGGAAYLTVCAELVNSRTYPVTALRAANGPGIQALQGRLMLHMRALSPPLVTMRMLRVSAILFGSMVAYHRLTVAGMYLSREEFRLDLISSLVGLLTGARPVAPRPD
jgi:AcrR family transcriptional regulator